MYSQIEEEAISKLYEILESPKDSTSEELKKAYRKLARKYHPDLNDDEESTKKMSDINVAYDILTHQNKLRDYLDNYIQNCNEISNIPNNQENNKDKASDYTSVETNDEESWKDASYTIIPPSYETFEEFVEYLKESFYEAYQNIRYEEKAYTLKNRYEDIYQLFSKYTYCEKIQSKLLREGIKLITFSGMEIIWQLKKLKKHVDDTIPKYTVRNRKTLAGFLVLATLINPVSAKTNDVQPIILQSTEVTESNTEKIDILLDDSYKLIRIYKVKPGDTLSDISINLNTTIDNIKEKNNLESSELCTDQVLEIPYYINKDELKYYTTSVNTDGYEKLEDLAEKYQTDIRTIYSINTEAFAEVDGRYIQISNELLVPTFPTQKEVQEQKTKDTYQKTSN